MQFERYAIFYTLPRGPLADFGARWLGWDLEHGVAPQHPDIEGLPAPVEKLTARARKYGLHGTIKPPFRLAGGKNAKDLAMATRELASQLRPVLLDGLELSQIGRFLALTVRGNATPLSDLAAQVVRDLDSFRAPITDAELDRRRKARLSPEQDRLLVRWGYPYVMEEFRFHITLTGPLRHDQANQVATALARHLDPILPPSLPVNDLTLVGEDAKGMFHEIARYRLGG